MIGIDNNSDPIGFHHPPEAEAEEEEEDCDVHSIELKALGIATCVASPAGCCGCFWTIIAVMVGCAVYVTLFPVCLSFNFSDFKVINSDISNNFYQKSLAEDTKFSSLEYGEGSGRRRIRRRRLEQYYGYTLWSNSDFYYRAIASIYLNVFFYSKNTNNILTEELLEICHAVERGIKDFDGYHRHSLIYKEDDSKITALFPSTSNLYLESAPGSFLNYIFPQIILGNYVFNGMGDVITLEDGDIEETIRTYKDVGDLTDFFDFSFDFINVSSKYLAAVYPFGYSGSNETKNELSDWVASYKTKFFDKLGSVVTESIGIAYSDSRGIILENELYYYLELDLLLAIVSLIIIYIVVYLFCRSFYITTLGLLGVIAAFIPCFAIYEFVWGESFNLVNMVSIWVILGIGCDDICVFISSYRRAPLETVNGEIIPNHLRLAFAFREAGSAMFVTSFTTACSFFSLCLSTINPLPQFGWFLGSLVLANFVLVMSWFPCIVQSYVWFVMASMRFKCHMSCCNRWLAVPVPRPENYDAKQDMKAMGRQQSVKVLKRSSLNKSTSHSPIADLNNNSIAAPSYGRQSSNKFIIPGAAMDVTAAGDDKQDRGHAKQGSVPAQLMRQLTRKLDADGFAAETHFSNCTNIYFSIMRRGLGVTLIVLVLLLTCVFSYTATKITLPQETAKLLPDDTNWGAVNTAISKMDIDAGQFSGYSTSTGDSTGKVVVVTTAKPTPTPTQPRPTSLPTPPSLPPTPSPSKSPTTMPPTPSPTGNTASPTQPPTKSPTKSPSKSPTLSPANAPTTSPLTSSPTTSPSKSPSKAPSPATTPPTVSPTKLPSTSPTLNPVPTATLPPSNSPTLPTTQPTMTPTIVTSAPSPLTDPPTANPSPSPSQIPSIEPSQPTKTPSGSPSRSPTKTPTTNPSASPSQNPSPSPSDNPSPAPSKQPSSAPSSSPTQPSLAPSHDPSSSPTQSPTYAMPVNAAFKCVNSDTLLEQVQAGKGLECTVGTPGNDINDPFQNTLLDATGTSTSLVPEKIAFVFEGGGLYGENDITGCGISNEQSPYYDETAYVSPNSYDVKWCFDAIDAAASAVETVSFDVLAPFAIPTVPWFRIGVWLYFNSSWNAIPTVDNTDNNYWYNYSIVDGYQAANQILSVDEAITIDLVFGTKSVSDFVTDCDGTVTSGTVKFNKNFNIYEPAAQERWLDLCEQLNKIEDDIMYRQDDEQNLCFSYRFEQYLNNSNLNYQLANSRNGTLFNQYISTYVRERRVTGDDGEEYDARTFNGWFGTQKDDKWFNNNASIVWISQTVTTQINKNWGGAAMFEYYSKWQDFMDDFNAESPASFQGVQTSGNYIRMEVEVAFLEGFVKSVLYTIILCAIVMIFFTQNVYLVLLVCAYILIICIWVVGLFGAVGWPFGIIEIISVPTVVGLTIDYALHITHAYIHSPFPDRRRRAKSAVNDLGSSVFASAMTTISSMLILYFATIVIFSDLGWVVGSTTTFGVALALFVCPPCLMFTGPQYDECHLSWFCPHSLHANGIKCGKYRCCSNEWHGKKNKQADINKKVIELEAQHQHQHPHPHQEEAVAVAVAVAVEVQVEAAEGGGGDGADFSPGSAPNNTDNGITLQDDEEDFDDLPDGWKAVVTDDGQIYYQNDVTQETRWKKPVRIVSAVAVPLTTSPKQSEAAYTMPMAMASAPAMPMQMETNSGMAMQMHEEDAKTPLVTKGMHMDELINNEMDNEMDNTYTKIMAEQAKLMNELDLVEEAEAEAKDDEDEAEDDEIDEYVPPAPAAPASHQEIMLNQNLMEEAWKTPQDADEDADGGGNNDFENLDNVELELSVSLDYDPEPEPDPDPEPVNEAI